MALLLCLCGISSVQAEEALTWEECAREVQQHNPDLLAAEATVREARAKFYGSFGTLLPQVSANLGVDRGTSRTSTKSSSLNDNSLGLSASEALFSGFHNEAQIVQQRANLQAAEGALAQAKAQVGFNLRNAFAQLLFAQEEVRLTESIAARRRENVRMIGLRYQAGSEHQGSLLRTQAAASQADFDVVSATRALHVAQQQLAQVMGRRQDAAIAVTGTFDVTPPSTTPDFQTLMTQTPAHRQADAQARSANAGVTVARSSFFPTVSATGSLSRSGTDWLPSDHEWLAGVVVSLPLFRGGQTWFDVRSAAAERDRAKASLDSTDNQTVVTLQQAFASYQDAAEKVGVQQAFLHAAQVREEIATSQYSSGLLSFQDWDLIEDDLISNQKTMLTTQRDAVIAEAAWDNAQGKGPLP